MPVVPPFSTALTLHFPIASPLLATPLNIVQLSVNRLGIPFADLLIAVPDIPSYPLS